MSVGREESAKKADIGVVRESIKADNVRGNRNRSGMVESSVASRPYAGRCVASGSERDGNRKTVADDSSRYILAVHYGNALGI